MDDRWVFTHRFAAALTQACVKGQVTQKELAERIAAREHRHRRPGREREKAIDAAREQWPRRLSAWKKGDRLPGTLDELFLALDVIAPGTHRAAWEQWWRQARGSTSAVDAQTPSWRVGREDELGLLANARHEPGNVLSSAAGLRTTLPAAPAGFFGRADDLDTLLDALGPAAEAPTAVCVAGPPGVGKTALVLVAAHRALAERLFTGALFVDVLGYRDAPADPADLLAILLRGLDVDVSTAGSTAADREAIYRARLAELTHTGKSVLIVADNVADAAAVRTLLPPCGPHRLLVTSRHTLHTLDARLIDLPTLPDDASAELLVNALRTADPADARARTAPDGLTALARLCGGLPLALRITAALLIREPRLAAAELAEDLVEIGPMEGFDDGEQSVRAALELSYRGLSPELAELFRLLVLNPGPDLSTEAAGELTGLPRSVLRRRLAELSRAHLIDGSHSAGRWKMHPLVRAFASECMHDHRQLSAETYGRAEQQRLLRHYLARLGAADVWVRGFVSETETPESFPDLRQALGWLDDEHVNLVGAVDAAAATGNRGLAVGLALGLTEYLGIRLLRAEAMRVLDVAAQVAETSFERAKLLDNQGNVLTAAQRYDQAVALHGQALELFRGQGRLQEEGMALMHIGIAHKAAGRPADAIAHYRRARAIFQQIGRAQQWATSGASLSAYHLSMVWNNMASAWVDDLAFGHALHAADRAAAGFRILGNTKGELVALFNRYRALSGLGRDTDALDAIELVVKRSADAMVAPRELGQFLAALADALQAAGHPDAERQAALEAAAAAFDEANLPAVSATFRQR